MAKSDNPGIREQVKALIQEGKYTKAEIAEMLNTTTGNVSSQMTYLRWMQNCICWDADKKLRFCTAEEYAAWQAEMVANRRTKATATRTPEEQAVALAKTLSGQNKSLAMWEKKLRDTMAALDQDNSDEELNDFVEEIKANITILELKIKRNVARAETLPEVIYDDTVTEGGKDVENNEDSEDLL